MSTASRLDRLRSLTTLLDDGLRIPGTRFRFGLDPILGLAPGVGDAAGLTLGALLLVEAVRLGVSRATLLRMAAHVAVDAALGAVPLLGDLFDAAWKANRRNLTLLERHAAAPDRARQADRWFLLLVLGGLAVLVLALLAASVTLAAWLVAAVAGLLAGR